MRLLMHEANDAFTNMAIDEAVIKSGTPTLRLYSWQPPAVSIGYFQSLEAEVDTEKCSMLGIDVVRRITGGGAVFHHDELTYSLIVPEDMVPHDIMESYGLVCGVIVKALKSHGIEAEYAPINDIIVNGKKISGSAQTRREGMVLQHGTILFDVDPEKMFSILKVPDEKLKDKLIKDVRERVTSFRHLAVSPKGLHEHIKRHMEYAFNTKLMNSELTAEEVQMAHSLKIKFMSDEWNRKR